MLSCGSIFGMVEPLVASVLCIHGGCLWAFAGLALAVVGAADGGHRLEKRLVDPLSIATSVITGLADFFKNINGANNVKDVRITNVH